MPKEIIYTVIAKETKLVLSEYTEHRGNFEIIAQNILTKLKDSKGCIILDK